MKKIIIFIALISLLLTGFWIDDRLNLSTKIQNIGNNPSEAFMNLFQIIKKDGLISTISQIQNKLSNDPRLGLSYSLQNPLVFPEVEKASERKKLPSSKVLLGVDPKEVFQSKVVDEDLTWLRSNGGNYSNKYSSLDQINEGNIQELDLAWSFKTTNNSIFNVVETTPVYVNGWLFITTLNDEIVCLNAKNGEIKWKIKLPGPVAKRGLVLEENDNFKDLRLFVTTSQGIYSIFADSGTIQTEFGNNGKIANQLSLVAPVITDKHIIVAIIKPSVEAYDLNTGKLIWSKELLESTDNITLFTGGVPWGGMSYDPLRRQLYIATGNPRPEVIGVTRLGDNKHSASVISIDVDSGKIIWSFQEVSHDLWDLDIPSVPILTTIERNNNPIDVVATVTKTGNTILLERSTGQPIYDIPYRKVSTSKIPGEVTSAYQPDFNLPEPFLKKEFSEKDLTTISDESYKAVKAKIADSVFGFFEPPILGGSIVLYGVTGGASWPGASVDKRNGTLFVPSTSIPYIIRVVYKDLLAKRRQTKEIPGYSDYQNNCASCHEGDRGGKEENSSLNQNFIPSLHGITYLLEENSILGLIDRNTQHTSIPKLKTETKKNIYNYLKELDIKADTNGVMAMNGYWKMLLDHNGYPGSNPPWTHLTAINLNTGKHKWRIPLGEVDFTDQYNKPKEGEPKTESVISTAGDILFVSGTTDKKLRVLSSLTGKEIWSYKLSSPGTAPPMTYEDNGIQYLAIIASGLKRKSIGEPGDHLYVFKLSSMKEKLSDISKKIIDKEDLISNQNISYNINFTEGKRIYEYACASCHNSGVANSPVVGDRVNWIDRIDKGKEVLYKNSINGFYGEKGYMPAKGGASNLTDGQVINAVDYMLKSSN